MPDAQISPSNPVGALILLPIFIAASAAFVALKLTKAGKRLFIYLRAHAPALTSSARRRSRARRSNLSSSFIYGDSFADLESRHNLNETADRPCPVFSLSQDQNTPTKIWHPNRSSRLTWSFMKPQYPGQNHFELSSVQKPLPVIHPHEKSQSHDENP